MIAKLFLSGTENGWMDFLSVTYGACQNSNGIALLGVGVYSGVCLYLEVTLITVHRILEHLVVDAQEEKCAEQTIVLLNINTPTPNADWQVYVQGIGNANTKGTVIPFEFWQAPYTTLIK